MVEVVQQVVEVDLQMVQGEVADRQMEVQVVEDLMKEVVVLLFEQEQHDLLLWSGWRRALLSILGTLHHLHSVLVMFPG